VKPCAITKTSPRETPETAFPEPSRDPSSTGSYTAFRGSYTTHPGSYTESIATPSAVRKNVRIDVPSRVTFSVSEYGRMVDRAT